MENKKEYELYKGVEYYISLKYYTPSLEEFHVGFEYEVFQKGQKEEENTMYLMAPQTEDKWYKFTYPDPFLGYNLDRLFKQTLRVKYLDQEGIEDCGFVHQKDINEKAMFTKGNVCLIYNFETKEVAIITADPSKDEQFLKTNIDPVKVNKIKIKNKSELKRLMKQLNIS